jgi:hypothetical protein
MATYTMLWEIDVSKIPFNPQQAPAGHLKMIDMVKQTLKDNPGSDWGLFVAEHKGYVTGIKDWQTVVKIDQMFSPMVKFKVYQTISVTEDEEMWQPLVK